MRAPSDSCGEPENERDVQHLSSQIQSRRLSRDGFKIVGSGIASHALSLRPICFAFG